MWNPNDAPDFVDSIDAQNQYEVEEYLELAEDYFKNWRGYLDDLNMLSELNPQLVETVDREFLSFMVFRDIEERLKRRDNLNEQVVEAYQEARENGFDPEGYWAGFTESFLETVNAYASSMNTWEGNANLLEELQESVLGDDVVEVDAISD